MSSSALPSLQAPVVRTYQVGLRFEGGTREARRRNELKGNQIIKELQHELQDKLTATRVDRAIQLLRTHPNWAVGTRGAAKLAKELGDRSNLGQAAYLILLNAAKGLVDRERKLKRFLKFLAEEPEARVEWYVFGRTPYLEKRLTYHFSVKFDYCRNLVLSARRTLDPTLPASQHLTAPLPSISYFQFLAALDEFYETKLTALAQVEELSENQQHFKRKLKKIHTHREWVAEQFASWVAEWNQPEDTTPRSWWSFLKLLSGTVHRTFRAASKHKMKGNPYVYLSILRGILISALTPYYQDEETVKKLRETELHVEQLVPKPFRKSLANTTSRNLLPLHLVMGSKYVVGRPGNNAVLTELFRREGCIQLQLWRPRPNKKTHQVTATVRIHPKLREFLTNGARIQLIVLRSGPPPAEKLHVSLVLEGRYWMFLSRRAIEHVEVHFRPAVAPVAALGLDVNRPGIHMLTLSEPILLPPLLLALCQRYIRLGEVIRGLSKAVTRATHWAAHFPSVFSYRYKTKMEGELGRVHDRRARILEEIKRESRRFVCSCLIQTGGSLLSVEDLHVTPRGTRGALAKAIIVMPDEEDLYARAVLQASYISGRPLELRKVNPAYTSQGRHQACPVSPPGRIIREEGRWDYGKCSACQQWVNTHREAAGHIRDLGRALGPLYEYLLPRSLFACPATHPPPLQVNG